MATAQSKVDPSHLTLSQVIKAFGVSDMTVYNWRMGLTNKPKLPAVVKKVGQRQRVFFKREVVQTWAEKQGLKVKLPAIKKVT